MKKSIMFSIAALLCSAVLSNAVFAQASWPTKPITIIVPTAAGGPTDTLARLVAESMSNTLKQAVIVENVSGAGGTMGMGRVARASADGNTLAIWHVAHTTSPALYDNLKFDVVGDFDHIGRIADVPMVLVSKTGISAKNTKEILDWIRQQNGAATYGHAGIGSAAHLCSLMLMKEANLKMTGVPYRGTGPAMTDLIGGQFDIMCDQTTNTLGQLADNKIKGYAVTTAKRVAQLADMPTLSEAGVKDFDVSAWHGMWAPKGLPKEVSDKLVAALQIAVKEPKVVERLTALGVVTATAQEATPEALRSKTAAETARWTAVISAAQVKGN